ncbi:MAG: HAD-IIIC family phosphatase [Deltaproteobacteria bacterium]|nr:HAD-IIIC family phosphatase [Deltaproteobacteria bacterium]
MNLDHLKALRNAKPEEYWSEYRRMVGLALSFSDLFALKREADRAKAIVGRADWLALRLALIGGANFRPFCDGVEAALLGEGIRAEIWVGEIDRQVWEVNDPQSELVGFRPDVVAVFPAENLLRWGDGLRVAESVSRGRVNQVVEETLGLCQRIFDHLGAEVLLLNYPLFGDCDLGPYRNRQLGSLWAFRKMVNLELGLRAPAFVRVCDLEFLSARLGTDLSRDARGWLESRQPFSQELMFGAAKELAHMISRLRQTPKKVLVLDLDNTLWGGILGEEGVEGVALGHNSARGEAFKGFQSYVKTLAQRGILLVVCSKNDDSLAREAFVNHPEMVLKMDDLAGFSVNWGPKSEAIASIARQLALGLESFVFVDDNPAEIAEVNLALPEVATVVLGDDPVDFVRRLQRGRHFEPHSLLEEDFERGQLYHQQRQRKDLKTSVSDLKFYLRSLEMVAEVQVAGACDLPRVAQLIGKSNQFNLTAKRRTLGEIQTLLKSEGSAGVTVRLRDRFGDQGLIAAVLLVESGQGAAIDTWVMSCRVLGRQVEELTVNALVALAERRGWRWIRANYVETAKNRLVKELLPNMGFVEGELDVLGFTPRSTFIVGSSGEFDRSPRVNSQTEEMSR